MHAKVELDRRRNRIALRCDYQDRELAKAIPGYKWDGTMKRWTYPVHPDTLRQIKETFPLANIDLEVLAAVSEIAQRQQQADRLKSTGWEQAEPLEPMPIRAKPFRHQVAAYNFVCTVLGVVRNAE